VKLPPVYTGGYVAAPVKAWLFQDHVQSISGMLISPASRIENKKPQRVSIRKAIPFKGTHLRGYSRRSYELVGCSFSGICR
jgi:hypothetical protein